MTMHPTAAAVRHWVVALADFILRRRVPLLLIGIAVTVLLALSATRLRVEAGFSKMIPLNHEYMQTFQKYQNAFGSPNTVLIALHVTRDPDIFTKPYFDTLKEVNDAIYHVKGVDRAQITSLFSANVRYMEVVEDGFRGGVIVPANFNASPLALAQVRENLAKSDWVGRIVSNDLHGSLISVGLLERDPETGRRLDLQEVAHQLEAVRAKYSSDAVSVHIIGFAKAIGDIADGAEGVIAFFGLAALVTAVLLLWYSGSLKLTVVALACALIPVVWLLGLLPLFGLSLDPMSILVPFLIFSIGVSHAVQMTNAWRNDFLASGDGLAASRSSFIQLFVPGASALLANALGFTVIALVDIEMVRELALTATIGVTVMIATNKVLLPILLSYLKLHPAQADRLRRRAAAERGESLWTGLSTLAHRGPLAGLVIAVSVVLFAAGWWKAHGRQVGDSGKGVPELRESSRYNRDVDLITSKYMVGVDVLQVVAEVKGHETPCIVPEVMDQVDNFELTMQQDESLLAVRGLAGFAKMVNASFNEGSPKWAVLPGDRAQLGQTVGYATKGAAALSTTDCKAMSVFMYPRDHEARTIAALVSKIKDFKSANDNDTITYRLAAGNVGIMAATNEVVEHSDKWVNLALFGTVALLCLLQFRSFRWTLCIILPLGLVTVLCNALMSMLDIGLKVNTLPVVALGVGVGVDYGIYLVERIKHAMHEGMTLQAAFVQALRERGAASMFTAVTMTIGVATWALSALKFQADMGVLLGFMFMVNLLGAILLLPALAAWIGKSRAPQTAT
jgi:uncharacterized protein